MHTVLLDQPIPDVGQVMRIEGDEAVHASRVKRLEMGDALRILDGAGVVALANVDSIERGRQGPIVNARIQQRAEHPYPPLRPSVEVFAATPKGGRVDEMIDGLSQVGASTWHPLETSRGVVDPRDTKLARLERIAREAAKQAVRPWILRIGSKSTFEQALQTPSGTSLVLADSTGSPSMTSSSSPPSTTIRLLIGPEGGWTPQELDAARSAGATIARFGPYTMRIETAAIAACAAILRSAVPT